MKCRECQDYAECVKKSNLNIKRKTCKKAKEKYMMTNADRVRGMSDDELVEFIKNIKVRAAFCKSVKNNDAFEELCSAEWLKQPAE